MINQAKNSGDPLPDFATEEAPELIEGLGLYYLAFYELDSDRSHAFQDRISVLRIREYCESWKYDETQMDDALYFIPKMDIAFLDWMRGKKQETKSGNTANPSEPDKRTPKVFVVKRERR